MAALVRRTMDPAWSAQQVADALVGRGHRGVVLEGEAALEGSVLIGFVLARRVADLLEIDLVGVDPAARRAGHGRALLGFMIEREQAAGAREARLELAAGNLAARALYEGLGFVVVGRRSRYYPDGDDALLLTLSLR